MKRAMASLTSDLPPHCQIKKRKGYSDVYFMPHPKDRPEGWRPTTLLGRTDKNTPEEITVRANQIYAEYMAFLDRVITGEDISKKTGTLIDVIHKYKTSGFWEDIAPKTRQGYEVYLKEIEAWSVDKLHPHIKEMTIPAIVKWLGRYEDRPIAQRRAKTVLSIVYEMAKQCGYVEHNLAKGIKLRKRKTEKRALVIWEQDDIEKFIRQAVKDGFPSIGRALIMALETSQRRGDVLRMQKPRDYDPKEGVLKFRQSKTKKLVEIPGTQLLKRTMAEIPAEQLVLFVNERTGRPWDESVFTHTVRDIADKAGLKKHLFAYTRHSSILYLNRAGVDRPEIASITGHTMKTIDAMLDGHYLESRDAEMAKKAIAKVEVYRKSQTIKSDTRTDK